MYINGSHIKGHLVRDPKTGFTGNGIPFANFTVAVNHPKREKVSYISCKAYNNAASVIGEYAKKGREIFVEGELETDTWADKNGTNHTTTSIIVNKFSLGKMPRSEVPVEAEIRKPGAPLLPEKRDQY